MEWKEDGNLTSGIFWIKLTKSNNLEIKKAQKRLQTELQRDSSSENWCNLN